VPVRQTERVKKVPGGSPREKANVRKSCKERRKGDSLLTLALGSDALKGGGNKRRRLREKNEDSATNRGYHAGGHSQKIGVAGGTEASLQSGREEGRE